MSWDKALGLADGQPTVVPTLPPRTDRKRSEQSDAKRRRARRARERREEAGSQRRDIQGLRAVAVVIVVVNHMFEQPKGGFLGVDVFFVISGYLITGLLLREEQRRNTLSLLDFYRRRIRRLFPSAFTVTALTVLGAYLLFGHDRFVSVVVDAVSATAFVANWRFIATGTDYFASLSAVSPLQHYWSLSVEEQYYLVWPLALLVACALARRIASHRRNAVTVGVLAMGVVLVAASAVVAFQQTENAPVVAYFSTLTRGWELGLGSVLAVLAPKVFPLLTRATASVLSWVGLVAVFVSFFVIGSTTVPMPGAILPCVGAALVILGWSERGEARNPVLVNPVSGYLGDISYSVYVVHFPVIVLASTLVGDRSASVVFKVTVALLVLGLSMLLYHLVEDPVRRSEWLVPKRKRKRTPRPDGYRAVQRRAGVFGALFCVAAVGAFVLVAPPSASDERYQQLVAALATASDAPGTGDPDAPATPQADALKVQLTAALTASAWPKLDPPMDQPRSYDAKTEACTTDYLPAAQCTWGNASATHTIYLVGDSTSVAYINAFASAVSTLPDWKVRAASGDGCPWTSAIPSELKHRWPRSCTERNASTITEIKQMKPDLLVLTHGHTGTDYQTETSAQLTAVQGSVGKLVLLPNGPAGQDPGECYNAVSTPAACISQPDTAYRQLVGDFRKLATTFGGVMVDPTAWFCVESNCPGFVGTIPVRFDIAHITTEFSTQLGPVLREALHNLKLV